MRPTTELAALLCAAALAGCGSEAFDPPCVPNLTPTCAAQYDPPSFDTINDKILAPTCGAGDGTCHTADVAMAGLVFSVGADTSYDLLKGHNLVIPGDPGCSILVKRLYTKKPLDYHMPPGPNSLSDGELCTIVQWISQGAAR